MFSSLVRAQIGRLILRFEDFHPFSRIGTSVHIVVPHAGAGGRLGLRSINWYNVNSFEKGEKSIFSYFLGLRIGVVCRLTVHLNTGLKVLLKTLL